MIVSVGEEESAKLDYNKLFEHDRRADGALFVTPGTCLDSYKSSQIMYRLLLLAFRPLLQAQDLMPIEEGSKLLARGALGPFALGNGSFSPRAPMAVQAERRMAWRTSACLPKDQPRSFMRLLEQGPESQSASWICSVGPSSLMNASDLIALSLCT